MVGRVQTRPYGILALFRDLRLNCELMLLVLGVSDVKVRTIDSKLNWPIDGDIERSVMAVPYRPRNNVDPCLPNPRDST
jgi:hypothetical protein